MRASLLPPPPHLGAISLFVVHLPFSPCPRPHTHASSVPMGTIRAAPPNVQPSLPPRDASAMSGFIAPIHRVHHPKGFKILKGRSVVERSLKGYFRLPPQMPKHLDSELQRVRRTLGKHPAAAEATGAAAVVAAAETPSQAPRRTLDGFRMLHHCKMENPEEVLEAYVSAQGYTHVVQEDMLYFPSMEFVDCGENRLQLGMFCFAPALQELHLHCNAMTDLGLARISPYMEEARTRPQTTQEDIPPPSAGVAAAAPEEAAAAAEEGAAADAVLRVDNSSGDGADGGAERGAPGTGEVEAAPRSAQKKKPRKKRGKKQKEAEAAAQAPRRGSNEPCLFARLNTLNVSYNSLTSDSIRPLWVMQQLVRIDLSYNPLMELPGDWSGFVHLELLALEKTGLDARCIPCLLTAPNLVEINLNQNQIRHVALQREGVVCDPSTGVMTSHFTKLAVVGLAGNPIASPVGLADFLRVPTLRRLVCWATLLDRRVSLLDAAAALFAASHIKLELRAPSASSKPPPTLPSKLVTVNTALFAPPESLWRNARKRRRLRQRRESLAPAAADAAVAAPVAVATPPAPEALKGAAFFLTEAETGDAAEGGQVPDGAVQVLESVDREARDRVAARHRAVQLPTVGCAIRELKRALSSSLAFALNNEGTCTSKRGAQRRQSFAQRTSQVEGQVVSLPQLSSALA